MGVIKFFSSSSFDRTYKPVSGNSVPEIKLPNPDPSNYRILQNEKIGDFLILMVNYPDCKNYEGNKILVFQYVTLSELTDQKLIDPHFSSNPLMYSPIARFEPSKKGWEMATKFCSLYK